MIAFEFRYPKENEELSQTRQSLLQMLNHLSDGDNLDPQDLK